MDSVSNGFLQGWARNTNSPAKPAAVRLHCNGNPIGTAIADVYRPDLEQAGVGDGKHGFAFFLPEGLEGELTGWVSGTRLQGSLIAPHRLSEPGPHQRYILARNYFTGEGIEIGALDKPMRVPDGVRVRTVDRLPAAELRTHYNLPGAVQVDYVCDAEKLETVDSASQDFVIANHVFEHMEHPVVALQNWVRVLRPGGLIFMAIPDKRFTFDAERPVTSVAHILEEYHDPRKAEANRRGHYAEWARFVDHWTGDIEVRVNFLLWSGYSVHFHCWTGQELIELFHTLSWIGFELDCFKANRPENIFVLRKL